MRKVTLESFCKDAEGSLAYQPTWTRRPFLVGEQLVATNGHVLVWRAATQEDGWRPVLADEPVSSGGSGRAKVMAVIRRHPGPTACRKPWPTSEPVDMDGPVYPTRRVYFPQKLRYSIDAAYRDRVARFGKAQGAEILYATPRSNTKPVAFAVGEYLGLLMPLREH